MKSFNKGYALVVGVANYKKVLPLPAAVMKDARDISQLFTDPSYCGYPIEQVKCLLDGQATAEGIRDALQWLADQTGKDDTAVFFFSGHGGRIERGSQVNNYLMPVECDLHRLQNTTIDSAELTTLLQNIKAGRLLVLFDCCYAGGIGETKDALTSALPELKSGLHESLYDRLSEGRGRAIIASSRSDEVSILFPKMENSLFTHYLLRALRGEAKTNGDGLIRLFDLFNFVAENVTKHKPSQHPVFKTNLENNFPIALYLGGFAKMPTNTTTQATTPMIGAEGIFNEDCTSSIRYHDIYTPYEIGACRLLKHMGRTHTRYSDGLVFQQRLKENINAARRHGDNETRRTERAEIIDRLNGLTLAVLEMSFNELCQLDVTENEESSQTIVTEEAIDPKFDYDVYISYVDKEPAASWLDDTLIPRLKEANLSFAVSEDVETPGVPKIVDTERAMKQCRRIMIVLSPTYLADEMADFQNVLGQTMGIYEDRYRLLPVKIEAINEEQLPMRLRMLGTINLIHPRRAAREFKRLVQTLQEPLPRRLRNQGRST